MLVEEDDDDDDSNNSVSVRLGLESSRSRKDNAGGKYEQHSRRSRDGDDEQEEYVDDEQENATADEGTDEARSRVVATIGERQPLLQEFPS